MTPDAEERAAIQAEGNPILSAALDYAQAGRRIFPCDPATKCPLLDLCPHFSTDATTDPKKITRWFTARPDALIAEALPPGVFVGDVDPRNGGDASLKQLEEKHGALPPTTETSTPGDGKSARGRHLRFKRPDDTLPILSRRDFPLRGLDIKSGDQDSYVILAPSVRPEGAYTIVSNGEPAVAPDWLVELLTKDYRVTVEAVPGEKKFTRTRPCPICKGHKDLPPKKGVRCWGFLSRDADLAFCTREEHAGTLPQADCGAFGHKLKGKCACGTRHGSLGQLWRTPTAVLDAIPQPKARFSVSIPSLNEATVGGIPTGRLFVVQGEPDSGKTGLAIQIGVEIGMRHDALVLIYAADGGESAAAVRVGGLLGLSIEKLDIRDDLEKEKLAEQLANRRIYIVEDSHEDATIENVIEEAEKLDPDVAHVLVVDSIQETPPGSDNGTSERDTVNATVRLLRRAKQSAVAWTIIATSEVVKWAFASKRASDRSRQIAAGSDSAKIGYAADLVVHLSGDPGLEPEFGCAKVVKNKLGGGKPSFALKLDRESLRLSEIDLTSLDEDRDKRRAAAREKDLESLAEKAWRHLKKHGPTNESDLRDALEVQLVRLRAALAEHAERFSKTKGPRNANVYSAVEPEL